jgi:hypothetical protein
MNGFFIIWPLNRPSLSLFTFLYELDNPCYYNAEGKEKTHLTLMLPNPRWQRGWPLLSCALVPLFSFSLAIAMGHHSAKRTRWMVGVFPFCGGGIWFDETSEAGPWEVPGGHDETLIERRYLFCGRVLHAHFGPPMPRGVVPPIFYIQGHTYVFYHNPGIQESWHITQLISQSELGSGFDNISPPILAVYRSVLCIPCFSTAPSRNCMGILFIVGFRSRRFRQARFCISPPILAVYRSVLCISCFSAAHCEITRMVLVIVGYRSRRFHQANFCIDWTHKVGVRPHHVARKWAHVLLPLFHLVAFSVDFFSRSSISWKNNMAKRLGPLNVL